MSLSSRIDQDMKQAMTAKDIERLSALRMLKSAIQYAAIERKTDSLSDAEAVQIIQKQIKQRRESIEQFQKGGRAALAEKELREAAVLESYLPKQLSDAELEARVRAKAQELGAASKKDFGRVMKSLTENLAGQAEPKRISDLLGKILT